MDKPLKPHQLRALQQLASNPDPVTHGIGPATLSLLRKRGLVGKQVTRGDDGRQKTLSPITEAGRALLASQGMLPGVDAAEREPMGLGYMQGRGAA